MSVLNNTLKIIDIYKLFKVKLYKVPFCGALDFYSYATIHSAINENSDFGGVVLTFIPLKLHNMSLLI